MIAASYGSVSDIELVWTLIAVVGFGLSTFNVRASLRDCRWLRETLGDRNGRWNIAWTQFKLEASRAFCQIVFFTIGVLAMLIPDAPTAHQPLRYVLLGAFFRWGLIAVSTLVTWQSWLNYRLRSTLNEVYSRPAPPASAS